MVAVRTKTCTKCGVEKPLSEFGKHRLSKDGHAYRCKECARKHSRAYSVTPAGIYNQIKGRTNFYKKNYNIRYKPVNVSREEFMKWYEPQSKKCVYCDIPEKKLKYLSGPHYNRVHRLTVDCIDNAVGYALGNMVLACNRCNFIKSNVFTFEEMKVIGSQFLKPKWEAEINQTAKKDGDV